MYKEKRKVLFNHLEIENLRMGNKKKIDKHTVDLENICSHGD